MVVGGLVGVMDFEDERAEMLGMLDRGMDGSTRYP